MGILISGRRSTKVFADPGVPGVVDGDFGVPGVESGILGVPKVVDCLLEALE